MTKNQETKAATRVRRSSDEVKAARIEREERLAKKAQERADRLAEQAKKALEKVELAKTRKEQIASNVSTRAPKAEVPTIKDPVAKRVTRELSQFMKELGQKHGLDFDNISPRLTRQGSGLSMHITGHVAGAMGAVKRAVGATREAARFMQFHKMVGIKPSLLNKEVQLAGEAGSFKVLGMKGRAHDVVLQKVGTDEIRNVPADQFKANVVSA